MHSKLINRLFIAVFALLSFLPGLTQTSNADALDNWTTTIVSTNQYRLYDVTYGNGRFVAVGDSMSIPDLGVILTSEDALNWTIRRKPTDASYGETMALYSVTYNKGLFVAVGYWSTIYSSTNGIDWVQRNQGPTYNLFGVTGSNGRFVAVGDPYLISSFGSTTTISNIFTSNDGLTWVRKSSSNAQTQTIRDVAFGAGRYVAVGDGGLMYTATSTITGAPWTIMNNGGGGSIVYGNGFFIVPRGAGTNLVSADGLSWTPIGSGVTNALRQIAYGHGTYIAISNEGQVPGSTVLTSTDGTNWVKRNVQFSDYTHSIALGDRRAIVLGGKCCQQTPSGFTFTSDSLSDIAFQSGPSPQLEVFGIIGRNYRLDYLDTSLTNGSNNWQTLTNFILPSSPYTWTDSAASNSTQRVYRAVLLP